jgi:hypothetical protein
MLNYQRVSPDIFFWRGKTMLGLKVWCLTSESRSLPLSGPALGSIRFWKPRTMETSKDHEVNHTLINSPHIWTIWTAHGFDSWGFLFRGSIRLSPISCPGSTVFTRQPPAMAAAECEVARGPMRRFQYMWADAGISGFSRLAALNPARWRGCGGGKEVEGTLW